MEQISKEIYLAIQQKEFADHQLVLSAEALDHAENEFRNVDDRIKYLKQRIENGHWQQSTKGKELARLNDEKEKANLAIDAILREKEGLEQESLLLAESTGGRDKEELLDAIMKIEIVDKKLQEVIQNFESLSKKIEKLEQEKLTRKNVGD